MKSFPRNLLIRMVLLFPLLSLVACGGGGGGSGGGNTPSLTPPTPEEVAATAVRAANAIPNEGSVTQSSRTGTVGRVADVTLDQVEVTDVVAVAGNSNSIEFTVTNKATGRSWHMVTHDSVAFPDMRPDAPATTRHEEETDRRTYRRVARGERVDGSAVIVEVFSDVAAGDDDYLAGGMWLFLPNDDLASGNPSLDDFVEIGAFADGTNPTTKTQFNAITKQSARYTGGTAGLYHTTRGPSDVGSFYGDVELTATFGNTVTVKGEVSNILLEDFDRNSDGSDPLSGGTIELRMTDVDTESTIDENFFTGATRGQGSPVANALTGSWGGQFYGADADKIGGTFGVSGDVPADTVAGTDAFTISAVGAFITEEDTTP